MSNSLKHAVEEGRGAEDKMDSPAKMHTPHPLRPQRVILGNDEATGYIHITMDLLVLHHACSKTMVEMKSGREKEKEREREYPL